MNEKDKTEMDRNKQQVDIKEDDKRSSEDAADVNESFSADQPSEDELEGSPEKDAIHEIEIDGETAAAPKKPAEKEDESERYLRLAAEFENFKKRTAREYSDVVRTANARIIRELVEIQDNFERALTAESGTHNLEAFRQGVELIYNQLTELLKKEQVQPIETVGKPFDPNLHEAMMQQPSNEYGDGIVCGEVQKGYLIGDKVVRHARVIVSTGPADGQSSGEDQDKNADS
jgi:molecular chaperone GrpE